MWKKLPCCTQLIFPGDCCCKELTVVYTHSFYSCRLTAVPCLRGQTERVHMSACRAGRAAGHLCPAPGLWCWMLVLSTPKAPGAPIHRLLKEFRAPSSCNLNKQLWPWTAVASEGALWAFLFSHLHVYKMNHDIARLGVTWAVVVVLMLCPQLWIFFLCFQALQRLLLLQGRLSVTTHVWMCTAIPPRALVVTTYEGLVPLVWQASWLSSWSGAALRACSRGLRQGSPFCLPTLPCPRLFLPLGWFWCWLDHSHPDTDPCGWALPARHLQGQGCSVWVWKEFIRFKSCFLILLYYKHSIKYWALYQLGWLCVLAERMVVLPCRDAHQGWGLHCFHSHYLTGSQLILCCRKGLGWSTDVW